MTTERSRLSIDLEPDQKESLESFNLPWGTKKLLFSGLVDLLIAFIKRVGFGIAYDALRLGKAKLIVKGEKE